MSVGNEVRLGIISEDAGKYPQSHSPQEKKLAETIRMDKNIIEDFDSALLWSSVDKNGKLLADSTLAADDERGFYTLKNPFEMHIQSVNGTVVNSFPFVSADGLELNVDDDVTNGVTGIEITNGILSTSSAAMTVGGDGLKYFIEAIVKIDGVSEVTELAVGFRKAEPYRTNLDDYDEMACFNIGETADGIIEIETILNGGTTDTTDTTLTDWADAGEHTLRVEVDKNGLCSFQYDGAEPTVVPNFSFDSGEVIVPFVFLISEGATDPGVSISSWKAGKY
jgi:hypothetical protein